MLTWVTDSPLMDMATYPSPYVIAHRGDSSDAAENSIEAFAGAIDAGADMIEFDVRRTADGELIAFHDPTVDSRPISRLRRGEIEAHTGVLPPLFSEVLELTRDRIKLDIELKEHGYVREVLETLRACAVEHSQIVITSFVDQVLSEVKQSLPAVRCGLLLGVYRPTHVLRTRLSELFPVARAKCCKADFLAPYVALARLGVLARAHAAGFESYVWTVNDPHQLERFLSDPRVAGVITDRTSLALRLRDGS